MTGKGEKQPCPVCGSPLLPGFTQPSRVDEFGNRWFACGGSTPEPWGCFGAHMKALGKVLKSMERG